MTPNVVPSAVRIAAVQTTSPVSAGRYRMAAAFLPKRRSKGSSSVVNPCRRMIGRKPEAADQEAQRVSPRCLHGKQAIGVGLLRRAIDIAAIHPRGRHREDADPQPETSSGEHHVAEAAVFRARRGPDAQPVRRSVEDGHRDEPAPLRRWCGESKTDGECRDEEKSGGRRSRKPCAGGRVRRVRRHRRAASWHKKALDRCETRCGRCESVRGARCGGARCGRCGCARCEGASRAPCAVSPVPCALRLGPNGATPAGTDGER